MTLSPSVLGTVSLTPSSHHTVHIITSFSHQHTSQCYYHSNMLSSPSKYTASIIPKSLNIITVIPPYCHHHPIILWEPPHQCPHHTVTVSILPHRLITLHYHSITQSLSPNHTAVTIILSPRHQDCIPQSPSLHPTVIINPLNGHCHPIIKVPSLFHHTGTINPSYCLRYHITMLPSLRHTLTNCSVTPLHCYHHLIILPLHHSITHTLTDHTATIIPSPLSQCTSISPSPLFITYWVVSYLQKQL